MVVNWNSNDMKRLSVIAVLTSCLMTVSCVKGIREEDSSELTLNSVVASAQLKSVIQTGALSEADAATGIGVCMLSESGAAYNGNSSYGNVWVYLASGKWKFASTVYLSDAPGTLYGYFPYNKDVKDISSIPVMASLNGTDYLYAEPVTGLNKKKSSTDVTMKHALSRITVRFLKDASYKGSGTLSAITLKSDGLSSSGILNALTGAVTATKSDVSLQGNGVTVTNGVVAECLVVPVPGKEGALPMEISCTIDGTKFTLPLLEGVCSASGLQSTITVNIQEKELTLVDLWTEPWTDGYGTSGSIDGMHKVNIRMENEELSKDVLFHGYSKGTGFVIEAYSQSGKALECSVPDDCECLPSQDWESRIYTFTITGFKKDITAVISYPHDEDILNEAEKVKVRNTAFYKTAFADAGYMFDEGAPDVYTKQPPAALKELLLSGHDGDGTTIWDFMEMVLQDDAHAEDTSFIKKYFDGYSTKTGKVDLNGPLLYPDGAPRFSVYYCFGGNAETAYMHRECIGVENMYQLKTFYENGGSFVASGGAGAVFLGSRYESETNEGYLSLYDANTFWTHTTSSTAKSIIMEQNSPLLEFGTAETVKNVTHDNGVYLDESAMPEGTEVLARYGTFYGEGYDNTGKAAAWAYKASENSGRIVLCGSKPEQKTNEENKNFLKSELMYAMEGNGLAKVKGVLHNGETRKMTLKEGDPAFCAIGDGQCHHFVFKLKHAAPKLYIKLDWETDARLDIYLKRGTYAFPEAEPEYSLLSSTSDTQESSSVLELNDVPAGLWFLTVRCATVPVSKRSSSRGGYDWSYYYAYSGTEGQIATLGGIPYSVSTNWTY